MKSESLRTVKHWQVGNESTNLVKLLDSRNLVANVELELVVKDSVGEPDLQHDNRQREFIQVTLTGYLYLQGQCRPPSNHLIVGA